MPGHLTTYRGARSMCVPRLPWDSGKASMEGSCAGKKRSKGSRRCAQDRLCMRMHRLGERKGADEFVAW